MARCARCGTETASDGAICPSCAAGVSGATESFEPVGVDDGTTGTPPLDERWPVLVVRKGPQSGERFHIDRARLTVGRDPSSDIFLNDMTVSRSHAALQVEDGVVWVRDDGSLNGTYVNGVCVDAAPLCDGDVVQIGTFQMVFLTGSL